MVVDLILGKHTKQYSDLIICASSEQTNIVRIKKKINLLV